MLCAILETLSVSIAAFDGSLLATRGGLQTPTFMSGIKDPERRKEADRKYRERNKEFYQNLRRYRRWKMKEHVRQFKEKPCADCTNVHPYYVMDFDHRAGTEKLFEIADYLASRVVSTYPKLDAEIAKCDVVCANCHRIRTQARLPVPKQYLMHPPKAFKSLKTLVAGEGLEPPTPGL
jgi:hypothetical protein